MSKLMVILIVWLGSPLPLAVVLVLVWALALWLMRGYWRASALGWLWLVAWLWVVLRK